MRRSQSRLRALLLLLLLATISPRIDLPARAQSSTVPASLGPDGGWIVSLATSPNFAVDGTAWAVPYGGRMFATRDGARTWGPSRTGITDPIVTSISPSPAFSRDATVFATADQGVFRSQDGGTTWISAAAGLGGHYARVVAFDPRYSETSTLLVGTDTGVFRSTDAAGRWSPTSLAASVISLAWTGNDTVLAGPSIGGVQRSTDGGRNWSSDSNFPTSAVALAFGAAGDGTVFAGTDAGLLESRDGGQTWSATTVVRDRIDAVAISPDWTRDGTAVAGSTAGGGLYLTTDAGTTWRQVTDARLRFISSVALARVPTGTPIILAGTVGLGVFESTDGGASFLSVNGGLAASSIDKLALSADAIAAAGLGGAVQYDAVTGQWGDLGVPSAFPLSIARAGNELLVGTEDKGLYISNDAGASWAAAGVPGPRIAAVALPDTGNRDGTVLAASNYVYMSTDSAATWTRSSGMTGTDVRRFAFSPSFRADRTVFAATGTQKVTRSTDGGLSWKRVSTGLPPDQVSDVLPSQAFAQDATVFAATGGDGVYVSRDRGDSWSPMAAQPARRLVTALAFTVDGTLLAGTEAGLFAYRGTQWARIAGTWDGFVTDLAVNGSDPGQIYVATLGDGVWLLPLGVPPAPSSTVTPAAVTFTSTPAPTPTVRVCCATATPSHKIVRAWVMPKPPQPGGVALLRIQGPGLARTTAVMTAPKWRRAATVRLDRRGIGALGFVAPAVDFRVTVSVRLSSGVGTTSFVTHVHR